MNKEIFKDNRKPSGGAMAGNGEKNEKNPLGRLASNYLLEESFGKQSANSQGRNQSSIIQKSIKSASKNQSKIKSKEQGYLKKCLLCLPRCCLQIKTINLYLVIAFLTISLLLLFAFAISIFFGIFQYKVMETIDFGIKDIVARSRRRISMTMAVVNTLTAQYAHESINIQSFWGTQRILYHTFQNLVRSGMDFPFTNVYAGKPNGEVNAFGRDLTVFDNGQVETNKYLHMYSWQNVNDGFFTTVEIGDVGEYQELHNTPIQRSVAYNATNNTDWVQNALRHCEPHFTPLYTTPWPNGEQSTYSFLTLTQSICTPETNYTVWGYVAIDEAIEALSSFLKRIGLTRGSSAFIVEAQTETIVAASDSKYIPLRVNENGNALLHTLSNTGAAVIRDSCSWIKLMNGGSLRNVEVAKTYLGLFTSYLVIPYYYGYYRFTEFSGIDWMIIYTVPCINMNLEFILFVPLVILFIIITLCISSCIFEACSLCMFSSFSTLKKQANNVEVMDLDNKIFKRKKSIFTEINALETSFHNMVDMLKLFKPFIPAYVISKIQNVNKQKKQSGLTARLSSKGLVGKVAPAGSRKTSGISSEPGNASKMSMNNSINTSLSKHDQTEALFSLGLNPNYLAVIHCRIANINMLLNKFGVDYSNSNVSELEQQHTKAMEILMNTCTLVQGFPVSVKFGEFSMMIQSDNKAGQKAAQFALKVADKMKELNKRFIKEGKEALDVHIGIAESTCLSGNIGSENSKHFSVVGKAVDIADLLSKSAKRLFPKKQENFLRNESSFANRKPSFALEASHTSLTLPVAESTVILISDQVFHEIQRNFQCRFLGKWESHGEEFGAYILLKENDNTGDAEWMYALQNEKLVSAYKALDEGFLSINNGEFEEAEKHYNEFIAAFGEGLTTNKEKSHFDNPGAEDFVAQLLNKMIQCQEKKVVIKSVVFENLMNFGPRTIQKLESVHTPTEETQETQ